MKPSTPSSTQPASGFLRRLARDRSGNTLALMAAGVIPLVAMVGGAVDMSRAYLASARLQQACDAGVLAARKYLGSSVVVDNKIPADVATIGNRFFNVNYNDGEYATTDRSFNMFLESDYAVTGEAAVKVPAVVMQMFGAGDIDIDVECKAELSVPSVDIMMALDVTGSMRHTNSGDTLSRIESLKTTIQNFYDKIEGSKSGDTITRYGFVPYNANVNVGGLLQDDWVVDNWTYQSREDAPSEVTTSSALSYIDITAVSGNVDEWFETSRYTPTSSVVDSTVACDPVPSSTYNSTQVEISRTETPFAGPPAGTQTHVVYEITENGSQWRVTRDGDDCVVEQKNWNNNVYRRTAWTRPYEFTYSRYNYLPILRDVSNWRTETEGCIEERSTYEITDYDAIDLAQALDLDIDLVPTPGNSDTQWRPMYNSIIYGRAIKTTNTGDWSPDNVLNTGDQYTPFGNWWQSDCPPAAQKLQEMTRTDLDNYLATLEPEGSTYHDIGMIWAGRLLSPTGLFAGENEDTADIVRSRHLIWMTDGQTEPYDLAYNAYGLEPLDRRRWDPATSTFTLTEVVENRFAAACEQVKNKNITVWVIAFGTGVTSIMEECAGEGRYFEATNADELNNAFTTIADSLGDLRITE